MPDGMPRDRVVKRHRTAADSRAGGLRIQTEAGFNGVPRRLSLADGTQIWIRVLRLDDREALTDLSSPRRLRLVAEPVGEPHLIVALADYTVLADEVSAEVGLLVEDAWQHNGNRARALRASPDARRRPRHPLVRRLCALEQPTRRLCAGSCRDNRQLFLRGSRPEVHLHEAAGSARHSSASPIPRSLTAR